MLSRRVELSTGHWNVRSDNNSGYIYGTLEIFSENLFLGEVNSHVLSCSLVTNVSAVAQFCLSHDRLLVHSKASQQSSPQVVDVPSVSINRGDFETPQVRMTILNFSSRWDTAGFEVWSLTVRNVMSKSQASVFQEVTTWFSWQLQTSWRQGCLSADPLAQTQPSRAFVSRAMIAMTLTPSKQISVSRPLRTTHWLTGQYSLSHAVTFLGLAICGITF